MERNSSPSSRHPAWPWAALLLLMSVSSAHAHIIPGETTSFAGGFEHPWSGWDHICAMIAVGVWGAQLGPPAMWLLPVTFPLVMAFGGFLGLIGVPVPFAAYSVDFAIGLSALLLGIMVCGEVRPKLWLAAAMVGFFGLCHGYAHGKELPANDSGLYYSMGFVLATGTLHGVGITIGLIHRWSAGQKLLRVLGAGVALAGVYFMWAALHPEAVDDAKPGAATAAIGHILTNHDRAS